MVKSTAGPDTKDRLDRLAALLKQQPFESETERRFTAKWAELIDQYEREYPAAIPPLLEFADNEWTTRVRWPKGWRS